VPVTTFDQLTSKQDSPVLQGVAWLETQLSVGTAALVAAIALTVLAVFAVLAAWRPRVGAPIAAVGCATALVLLGIGSTIGSLQAADGAKRMLLEQDARW